jgi:4-alpha-glucanotransferase
MSEHDLTELRELADLYGVLTEFNDSAGRLRVADAATIRGVLRAMDVPVDGAGGVAEAIRLRRWELGSRRIEPVTVAWDGEPVAVPIRNPQSASRASLECVLVLEDGERREWSASPEAVDAGEGLVARSLTLPGPLPIGYHRLTVRVGDDELSSLIIAAPSRAFEGTGNRTWGIFCPVYALHSRSSWGGGDFSDLEELMKWTSRLGGGLVAMLATCFDEIPWVSPYSPVSRLFGNEFYLDPRRIPEYASCEHVHTLVASEEFCHEVEYLRSQPLVDYSRQVRLKRRILKLLSEQAFADGCETSSSYRRFLEENPEAEDYAYFMAAAERLSPHWREWPEGFRGLERRVEVDESSRRYHLYVQWQLDEQLRALSELAGKLGLTWYVDYTVGVDPASFDVWRRREIFALNASVGCPPDEGFTSGQNWGFPPQHPERQREDGYAYLIAALRSHLRYAGALRIDHVMGLNRLYWIPRELSGGQGCYVRYPADEIYAILCVESHRQQAWVVGENLGTVPPEVPLAMNQHAIRGIYVVQHELSTNDDPNRPLRPVSVSTVASINTHDMPPFAAYWEGRDIDSRVALGLLDEPTADQERRNRPKQREMLVAYLRRIGLLGSSTNPADVLQACQELLASSQSRVTLLNIEDLWLETEPQNIPGTSSECPNWRRRLRFGFEEFAELPTVVDALHRVNELSRGTESHETPSPLT